MISSLFLFLKKRTSLPLFQKQENGTGHRPGPVSDMRIGIMLPLFSIPVLIRRKTERTDFAAN